MNVNTLTIEPSTFNRRIRVKRAITATDSGGGTASPTYTTRFETFASIDSMSTYRKAVLGIDAFESGWELRLRYTIGREINVSDLVDYLNGGITQTFAVLGVQLVKQSYKTFLVLTCREVTPQG